MPSKRESDALRSILSDLLAAAEGDLSAIWRLTVGMTPTDAAALMVDAFAQIVGAFMQTAADVASVWYTDLAPESEYRAEPVVRTTENQLRSSAHWAVAPLFARVPPPATEREVDTDTTTSATSEPSTAVGDRQDDDGTDTSDFVPAFVPGDTGPGSPIARLVGAAARHIQNGARDTITDNADEEGVRWARHAAPDACAFCRMLATRGAVYLSRENAAQVVGRRGRTRGNQSLEDAYHDNCHCLPMPDRPDSPYEPPEYVDGWIDEYEQASAATDGSTAAILREMRRNDIERTTSAADEDTDEPADDESTTDESTTETEPDEAPAETQADLFDGLVFPNIYYFPSQDNSLLPEAEQRALWSYASGGHRRTNEVMRGNLETADNIEEHIGLIESAMQRYTLPQTYRVTRSVEASDLGLASSADAESLLQEYLEDRAFLSTSAFRTPPFIALRSDPVVLDIIVPEGSHAILMNEGLSPVFEQERELLLPPGTRLQVLQVRYDDSDGVNAWRLAAIVRNADDSEGGDDDGRTT
ncbi:hypothetical protein GV792_04705 [Nocardia cyriacigeorgica]|uniref:VG15 protein n=1 Tax=Nocardia cyriacigeorgica TaxID=135487 RepID=UPI0013BB7D11|nr:ADP-ribosyltransferase [Nocardia cyriacigeorgica]NEW49343.1 hypothetical protein [Nocardia cyriacigeorgica]